MGGREHLKDRSQYGGIDYFRVAAAFLIVAIHTAPFSSWGDLGDTIVTYTLGRVAVPFFLMTTGYFVLRRQRERSGRFYRKTLLLYLAATVLYLPVNLYAGNLPSTLGGAVRAVVLDGTFYHLWYLPAAVLGFFLTSNWWGWWSWRSQRRGWQAVFAVSLALYVLGVLGDSWFYLACRFPPLAAFYQELFRFMSYTRNGIFFAPIFLVLGAWMADRPQRSRGLLWAGLLVSLGLLTAEGYLTHALYFQRHSSMYFSLLPVMVFLFALLRQWKCQAPAILRPLSQWIYILHPLAIIAVRGGAKVLHLTPLLVGNSMVHYLAVCAASTAAAWAVSVLLARRRG